MTDSFMMYTCAALFFHSYHWILMSLTGKGKSSEKAEDGPSKNEMHRVVVDILKKVDFNTVSNVFFSAISFFFQHNHFLNIFFIYIS